MKYTTKQQRMIAVFDAYQAVSNRSACTMAEVATWAIGNGLYPAPKRGDTDDVCEQWERTLEAVLSSVVKR